MQCYSPHAILCPAPTHARHAGKFYEMFEMDAHIGVDVLGLQLMRGEQVGAWDLII